MLILTPASFSLTSTAGPAAAVDWATSANGQQVIDQGTGPVSALPAHDEVVLVLPPHAVSWHKIALPKVPAARLRAVSGVMLVLTREEAVARFELPADRIGDLVLISTENLTLGTSAHRHDLAALNEPLRSHGGLTEQEVPFIVNRVLDLGAAPDLRNFDAFFVAATAAALCQGARA